MKKQKIASAPNRRSVSSAAIGFDDFDKRILSALRRDGRLTLAALSSEVGLSQSPCWTRVRRLEAAGVISGYVALLDHQALGVPDIVFIEVTLDRHDDKALESFGTALANIPEILEAYLVTGEYDYMIKVAVAGTNAYERFLREKLYRIAGIRQSRSTFALRALKRDVSIDPMGLPD